MLPSTRSRIILAGGRGFIGRTISRHLLAQGHDVMVLTRESGGSGWPPISHASSTNSFSANRPPGHYRTVAWNGRSMGDWWQELDGAAGVVNLAGRSINCRPTPENLRSILQTRVDSIRALSEACRRCQKPPPVWVQPSALAIYADQGSEPLLETAPWGSDTLALICREWEAAMRSELPTGMRSVLLRIGIVLGRSGGAYPTLRRIVRWGLGGSAGSGRQYVSWIHELDMAGLVETCLFESRFEGAYNACTPGAVTNRDLMRALRAACHRPWSPPAPSAAIRVGAWLLGSNPELVLTGRRGYPKRLLDSGFIFQWPELSRAVSALENESLTTQ